MDTIHARTQNQYQFVPQLMDSECAADRLLSCEVWYDTRARPEEGLEEFVQTAPPLQETLHFVDAAMHFLFDHVTAVRPKTVESTVSKWAWGAKSMWQSRIGNLHNLTVLYSNV